MKQLLDTVWQRHGTSWLWDEEARNQVCVACEVLSLRQLVQKAGHWADELPSNDSNALVVAGLEGSLDLLSPEDGEAWLADVIKPVILSFQAYYEGQAALVFWMPAARDRLKSNPATDAVTWLCEAPHRSQQLDFGRILWGAASDYPQEILLRDGSKAAGLFHLRIT